MVHSLSAQAQGAHARDRGHLPAKPLGLKTCRLAELGAANPDAVLELAADGFLICMTAPEVTRAPATAPSVACSGRP
ncbi:MAG: hypothetical protein ACK5QQ_08090 [Cyanobacteriota bacterium]